MMPNFNNVLDGAQRFGVRQSSAAFGRTAMQKRQRTGAVQDASRVKYEFFNI